MSSRRQVTTLRISSTSQCFAISALCFLVSLASGTRTLAEQIGSASLGDLSWIAGNWVGSEGETVIQEQWSSPEGNSMMGMFRLIEDGKVVFYEFMSIEQETEGPVLRIKHFNPGLEGWEEKDDSILFDLEEVGDRRAVFSTLKDGDPERLIFERQGDELVITLEKPAQGTRTPFRYKHSQP